MGFKADTSFLRFLTMGASAARQTMQQMIAAGFQPIELERYCTSNKIWSTKVKRLRLPDLMCVRTGLRVEVRAKTDLKIRMSDAPANPDRRWHSGLRDDDLSAFMACFDNNGAPVPADKAVFFTIADLKSTEGQSVLGPPKSASEGAERDRTWPCTVPGSSGSVVSVDGNSIRVVMDAPGGLAGRRQTYQLRGKVPYVVAGDRFVGGASILAGAPPRQVDLSAFTGLQYDPLANVHAHNPVDRYAAVKSLPYRHDTHGKARDVIEKQLDIETETRVLLEAAGSGAKLGSEKAIQTLENFVWNYDGADLRMEAVLILIEGKGSGAGNVLLRIANDPRFEGDEIRQAAVWGLGKTGLQRYADLLPFLGDADPDVVMHAIAAFGVNTSNEVVDSLIQDLLGGDQRRAAASSEAIRVIGSDSALDRLLVAAHSTPQTPDWLLATIGKFSPAKVREALQGDALLERVSPLLLFSAQQNWLANDDADIDLKFLLKQNL